MKYTWRDYLDLFLGRKKNWLVVSTLVSAVTVEFPNLQRPLSTDVAFVRRKSADKYAALLQERSYRHSLPIRYSVVKLSEWNETNSDATSS